MDQFSPQPRALADSRAVLNLEVNRRLLNAVERANRPVPKPARVRSGVPRRFPQCDTGLLYDALSWELARPVIGQVESFAEQSPEVDRFSLPLADSVYRDFLWPQSPSLVLSERMASVIRVGDVQLGSDKLGHFFTEGYSYFTITNELSEGAEQGLLFGEWSESVYFGAQTTGVFSFADLTANFNGLRFWNRVLALQPDPLAGGLPEPYVGCDGRRWQLLRSFDWADYVDSGWSENINCSLYRTPELLAAVLGHAPLCRREALPLARYGSWALRLLNQAGPGVIPDYLQPEAILAQRSFVQELNLPVGTVDYLRELREQLELWRQQQVRKLQEAR
ncbi:hypothetical protein ACQUQU_07805 [Thalassolituus sp. LLYu03]|uniref:hypothetical protein n=1 Tax=Thalassolituus sp. LLYu03 TaxID=3421656 RepID=UPI003D2CB3E2